MRSAESTGAGACAPALNGITCLESECNNTHSGEGREDARLGVGECCTSRRVVALSVDRRTQRVSARRGR